MADAVKVLVNYDGGWYNRQTEESVKTGLVDELRHGLRHSELPVEVTFQPRSGGGSYKVDVHIDTEPIGRVLIDAYALARHIGGRVASDLSKVLIDDLIGPRDIRVKIVGILGVNITGIHFP